MGRRLVAAAALLVAVACLAAETTTTKRTTVALAERVAQSRPKLRSDKPEERQRAYDAYLREGDEGRALLRDALLEIREGLLRDCRSVYLTPTHQTKLLKAEEVLQAARNEALRVIFDKRIYPDANHGRSGQPVVDEAVNQVKAIYPAWQQRFGSPLRRFGRALRAHERLLEVDTQLALCRAGGIGLKPPLHEVVGSIQRELVDVLVKETKYRRECIRFLRYNLAVKTSLSPDERKVVVLTNEYRMQLGLLPLAINERLVQAARRHSAEMAALRYFSHTSPTPENRDPGRRCRNVGYRYFVGENCAIGVGAHGAFNAWYHSSGHHRNMLNRRANEIGVGHAGPWTEDFGANPRLQLDHPPRHWEGLTPKPREAG